ncbi:MAG: S8 family serine peptidase [Bdellovibrionales bacterium]
MLKQVSTLVALLTLIGCGSDDRKVLNKKGEPVVADHFTDGEMQFPGGVPLFISAVKLRNPALLSNAVKKEDGSYEIDAELKRRVLAEQEDFELKLKGISSDIKVLFRYRMVLNAVVVQAPQEYAEQIQGLPIDFMEADKRFHSPKSIAMRPLQEESEEEVAEIGDKTSMTSVGVDKIHELLKVLDKEGKLVAVKGKGIKVGVIDSGIDYTHKMLGGSGDVEEYKNIDASKAYKGFPNSKVAGGHDFVGAEYGSSHIYEHNIPVPDENPLDYSGHGTHVAGTVAGEGDGRNTYDGAAPEAELYALKIFGDNRSGTSDSVVIAALEYAVDPNGDLSVDDKLDVVNLSIGSAYGEVHSLYGEALENLGKAGVVSVVSAGNDGAVPNIVGDPGSADAAITVAASIDYMAHNITFDAISVATEGKDKRLVEFVEGPITTPLAEVDTLKATLYHIGIAKDPLNDGQKEMLKGRIALIDRGEIPFVDKIKTAISGGAVGFLMVNNKDEPPFVMGGELEEPLSIPGVMISKKDGDYIKLLLNEMPVAVDLKSEEKIVKDELVNTITGFSSQGPRAVDAGFKPEITAPGAQIISASVGGGDKGTKMSGTSMAAPHIAGIAALLVQYRRDLSPKEIKSLIMNTSKSMVDDKGNQYRISRQGAGLIQAYAAATSKFVSKKPAIALGKVGVKSQVKISKKIKIKNISDEVVTYDLSTVADDVVTATLSKNSITLNPGQQKKIKLELVVTTGDKETSEVNAVVELKENGVVAGRIPVLAVVARTTAMKVKSVDVVSERSADSTQEKLSVVIKNTGDYDGEALLFNLLDTDERKERDKYTNYTSACDIQSAGYRIINKDEGSYLQVAMKLYNPITGWETCDVYVELDYDNDGETEQEITGSKPGDWPGFSDNPNLRDLEISSMLFDAKKFVELNDAYTKEKEKQQAEIESFDLVPALEGLSAMTGYRSSTVSIVEAPLESLRGSGDVKMKVSTSYNARYNVSRSDVLDDSGEEWKDVSLSEKSSGFYGMEESSVIESGSEKGLSLSKGETAGDLVIYFPRNRYNLKEKGEDKQSQIIQMDKPPVEKP